MLKFWRKKEVKFCKDCKFHKIADGIARCKHPKSWSERLSMVTGVDNGYYKECSDMRHYDAYCAREGKYFEPKGGDDVQSNG